MEPQESPPKNPVKPTVTAKSLLGWREWVALPSLGIAHIKAKVDTGARTSALHAFYLERYWQGEVEWVRFGVHPYQQDTARLVDCNAPIKEIRRVTDSGGHAEWRPVIDVVVVLGGVTRTIEMTLTDRENMRFRMLLGRSALKPFYWVDSGRSFLMGGDKNSPPSLTE